MKGHMEKDGFHPHTQYKGVRKSRDQLTKTEGVKIRKARTVTKPKPLPDVFSSSQNHSFQSDEGVISLSLDDFGWRWSGEEDQLNGFMARMSGSEVWNQLVSDFKDAKVTVGMLKPHLLKNLSGKLTDENDDGLYTLSGDNGRWHFGEDDEFVIEGEFDHFNQEGDLKDNEKEEFEEEFWRHYKSPTYERWLEVEGNGARQELIDGINNAKDFDDLDEAYKEVGENIEEQFFEFRSNESIGVASWEAVEAIKGRRDEEGKQKDTGKKSDVFDEVTR